MIVHGLRAALASLALLGATVFAAPNPLPPQMAFRPSAQALDGSTFEIRFAITDGYYLYRDNFRFVAQTPGVVLGQPILPPGKEKDDESFGKVQVYYGEARIRIPVERNVSGVLPLQLQVTSQGCAEGVVCYPPQKQTVAVELPDPATTPPAPAANAAPTADESGRIAQLLASSSAGLVALSFFGFGLLLAFTPCTFPMLPILSGIIVGAGRNGLGVSHARGFALSLAYVLGMAVTYTAAGVAAGLSGTLLTSALQNAWVLGGFALIFVILALSMFGFYELQLPSSLQSRLSTEAGHLKGGSLPTVGVMGALSALIVGPCVAAPLAGALLYIGKSGNALLGGTALFCMALGMGVPLLAVGASAGTLLPKSGPWMDAVKKAFGVILLGTALWLVAPLLPAGVVLAGWGLLLIVPAIFLRALDALPPNAGNPARFWKGIGVALLAAGFVFVVGALSGGSDPLRPLAGLFADGRSEARQGLAFTRVRSLAELDARLAEGKPTMLDFYADWCVTCKEMERDTFSDPRVQARVAGWNLVQADVTANSADDQALLARFALYGPPGIVFFDAAGKELRNVRVIGYQKADEFLKSLAATGL